MRSRLEAPGQFGGSASELERPPAPSSAGFSDGVSGVGEAQSDDAVESDPFSPAYVGGEDGWHQ
eukprot:2900313-Lingulodinium_polyedra.AAC.1